MIINLAPDMNVGSISQIIYYHGKTRRSQVEKLMKVYTQKNAVWKEQI